MIFGSQFWLKLFFTFSLKLALKTTLKEGDENLD